MNKEITLFLKDIEKQKIQNKKIKLLETILKTILAIVTIFTLYQIILLITIKF